MDPDVVKIPPSMFQHPPRTIRQKQSIFHDVIDIADDNENDDDDLILGEITSKHNKGKTPQALHEGYGDNHQVAPGAIKSGTVRGIESSNRQPSHPSFENDDYLDLSSDERKEVDEYALLQAQFDNVDLPTGIEAPFKIGSSSLQIITDNVDLFSGTQLSSKAVHSKKNPLEVESSKFRRFMKSVRSRVMSAFFGSKKHGLADNPDAMKPPYLRQFESAKQRAGSANPDGSSSALKSAGDVHNGTTAVLPQLTIIDETENETLRKLRSFEQFDIVIDTSDHHFINHNSSTKQNPKSWAKKIQEEWKILEKHLPDTIFVRVYESRMDLMRAVIIGAEGTPYHNGLFFFDIFFPSGYPNVPPKVHYHSGGLRINPNLYNCGKVCLSLLNTWPGSRKEKWTKCVSTMLQVLVSIQGLILNTTPFFNEPGLEDMRGTPNGEMHSLQYNEDTFIKSLQTMMYTIKKPPKNFEDLVVGHFYSRAHDILASCKAYMEGVQVGCMVKGGIQDDDGSEGKQCSALFRLGLVGNVPSLVKEFENIGVKDCEKFTSLLVPRRTTGRK